MFKFYLRRLLLVLFGLMPFTPFAQTDSTTVDNEYDVSLEDLLDMKVTVASKTAEKISDAPGSITAYSAQDMERLGYYTPGDLASMTAGYSSMRALNEYNYETRGQWASGGFDNNKHLVLIDGIPVYNARANMAPSDELVPLLGAQRVEFLRGPGSALYGIGAFNGVINVISKDLEQNGTLAESKVSLGNYDFKKRLMAHVVHKTDEGTFKLQIGYFAKNATRQYLGDSAKLYNELARYYDDRNCLAINTSFKLATTALKGTSVGLIYQRKDHGLGEWWMDQKNQTHELTDHTWQQIIPFVRYERKFGDRFSINSYLKGNISTETYSGSNGWQASLYWSGAGLSVFNIEVAEREFFAETRYKVKPWLTAIAGVNQVSRFGTGAPNNYVYYVLKDQNAMYNPSGDFSVRTSTYNTNSAFGQLQANINFLEGLNITAGARLDMGRVRTAKNDSLSNKYNTLSPRIAIVQKITKDLNLKLMYGKALRAPMVKEVGGNEEAAAILLRDTSAAIREDAKNVPNLTPEVIQSYEAMVTFNKKFISANVSVFSNITSNAMYRGVTPVDGQPIIQNIDGKINAKGLEVELTVAPIKNIKIGANYAYAKVKLPLVVVDKGNTDPTDNDTIAGGDPFNVPTAKVNGFLTYSMDAPVKLSATVVARMINSYTIGGFSPWRRSGSNMEDFNETYGGMTLFDLNIVAGITNNLSVELQVKNLLNTEYITPAFFQSRRLNVPGAARSAMVTLGYKF
jgi:outer membrane receptor for ferrienterochelin and colicins